LLAASVFLLSLLFPPFYCFFLAPVALVPLSICIVRRPISPRYILFYYLAGVVYFAANFFWIFPVTIVGLILLALYLGIYFPLFAFGLHRLTIQLRVPATFAVPILWTALEYVRSTYLEGGCPWFLLGNSLAPLPVLIQSADLFGVWGLTFAIGLLNGFVVDVLRLPLMQKVAANNQFSPMLKGLTALVMTVIALHLGYGVFRLRQQTTTPGPRIAVIQENIPQSQKDDPNESAQVFERHYQLAVAAARAQPRPDLVAWPETMVTDWINREFVTATPDKFDHFFPELDADRNRRALGFHQEDAKIVTDALDMLTSTTGVPQLVGYASVDPRDTFDASIKQNRTALLLPKTERRTEYAKRHLVPFGEYIPFKSIPIVGKWMVHISPNGMDYSNTRGEEWTRFELTPQGSPPGTTYTFGTPICFEDAMPRPAREMTAPQFDPSGKGRKTDFLVNVSNDGWFYWVELDQHLQACQMRAVENRVPIARAVNTGNSGFIDSNGRIVKLVEQNGTSIKAKGTAAVVLQIDSRITLFSKIGDLFPILCGILATLLLGWTFVRPRRA
jgi:apolipoprotein N-acyltransferase